MLNWEMEFKKWCPGFKIMTYYGNPKERKEKRVGWSKENAFHVCITSYQLVVQDQNVFRRKQWHYLVLDEAHNIKNFRSQRWQTLLNFNSARRLLLTGTPLQNNLMELWSLLYFLMPNGVSQSMPIGFANQKEFQEWFSHPVDRMIENNEQMDEETRAAITKLHTVLRPYLLRRLKVDVEKQMPAKYEHIVYCRLSKRQRFLYDDFMSRAKTRETLASGNFLSIINCLMQLRKVCNHPDLFEVRPIVTSFAEPRTATATYEIKELLIRKKILATVDRLKENVNLNFLNLVVVNAESSLSKLVEDEYDVLDTSTLFQQKKAACMVGFKGISASSLNYMDLKQHGNFMRDRAQLAQHHRWEYMAYVNSFRCQRRTIYGTSLVDMISGIGTGSCDQVLIRAAEPNSYFNYTNTLADMVVSYARRFADMERVICKFAFVTPKIVTRSPATIEMGEMPPVLHSKLREVEDIYHPVSVRLQIQFPDKRLLQYDCGKLQKLDELLRGLKSGGHRALIFTQMTRVLDILEIFLNIHGHRYLRLDGATKVEQRQVLTERFNSDSRILVFILSTRSGGLGINLTGADTVIFYDSDWNPCMDRQCQDRCHRIGQTRDVHIYRFVSEYTIEENMLRKANQKRMLDNVVIQEGEFTTDFFHKMDWRDMLTDEELKNLPNHKATLDDDPVANVDLEQALATAEDEADVRAMRIAKNEMDVVDLGDFSETAPLPSTDPNNKRLSMVIMGDGSSAPSPSIIPDTPGGASAAAMSFTSGIGNVDDYMLRFVEREFGQYVGFGGMANPENPDVGTPSLFDGDRDADDLTSHADTSRLGSEYGSDVEEEDINERDNDDDDDDDDMEQDDTELVKPDE